MSSFPNNKCRESLLMCIFMGHLRLVLWAERNIENSLCLEGENITVQFFCSFGNWVTETGELQEIFQHMPSSLGIFRGEIWSRGSELGLWNQTDMDQIWLYHLLPMWSQKGFLFFFFMYYVPLCSHWGVEMDTEWLSQNGNVIYGQISTKTLRGCKLYLWKRE